MRSAWTGWCVLLLAASVMIGPVSCQAGASGRQAPAPAPEPDATVADKQAADQTPTEDVSEEPKVDPDVDRVLKLAEKAGEKIARLDTEFDYEFNQVLIDDREWRIGRMVYKKPSCITIAFTDGKKETFRFNGRVYVEDRPGQKQRYVHVFRKAGAPPVSILDVEQLPFPHPFGQKREKLVKHYRITYRGVSALKPWGRPGSKPPEKKDNKLYEHLELVPRPDSRLAKEYARVEYWLDPGDGLFRQIRTEDKSERILTIRFRNIRTNDAVKVNDKQFEKAALPSGWQETVNDHTEETRTEE